MSLHLKKSLGENSFLLAPRPLQLSLAALSAMAKDDSITKRQLVAALGCNSLNGGNNCTFLLDSNLQDFGFYTNIQMDMKPKQVSNSNHLDFLWRHINSRKDEQLLSLKEVRTYLAKLFPGYRLSQLSCRYIFSKS